ncbi:hypothetical protein RDI58_015351 [Solanum bulbocastanum]|uniref:Secreted protein n=1 Tax=Solanum bulbocastanum TaxID=147425 RepID=A0AAN8TK03_SOLBU
MVSYGIKLFLVYIFLLKKCVGVNKLECCLSLTLAYTNAIGSILGKSAIFLVSCRLTREGVVVRRKWRKYSR